MALYIDRGKASKYTGGITPDDFFALVKKEFGEFDLDVCATREDTKADKWIEEDSLNKEWKGLCWMNPPLYESRGILPWIKKAYETGRIRGNIVVCLLPAFVDRGWFHEYVLFASEIRFIRGRLKFSDAKNRASFPSMLVIFKDNMHIIAPIIKTMMRKELEDI